MTMISAYLLAEEPDAWAGGAYFRYNLIYRPHAGCGFAGALESESCEIEAELIAKFGTEPLEDLEVADFPELE